MWNEIDGFCWTQKKCGESSIFPGFWEQSSPQSTQTFPGWRLAFPKAFKNEVFLHCRLGDVYHWDPTHHRITPGSTKQLAGWKLDHLSRWPVSYWKWWCHSSNRYVILPEGSPPTFQPTLFAHISSHQTVSLGGCTFPVTFYQTNHFLLDTCTHRRERTKKPFKNSTFGGEKSGGDGFEDMLCSFRSICAGVF